VGKGELGTLRSVVDGVSAFGEAGCCVFWPRGKTKGVSTMLSTATRKVTGGGSKAMGFLASLVVILALVLALLILAAPATAAESSSEEGGQCTEEEEADQCTAEDTGSLDESICPVINWDWLLNPPPPYDGPTIELPPPGPPIPLSPPTPPYSDPRNPFTDRDSDPPPWPYVPPRPLRTPAPIMGR
jgi:hypothetical protein